MYSTKTNQSFPKFELILAWMPICWMFFFYIYYTITSFDLGHLPVPSQNDPKNLSTWWYYTCLVAGLIAFMFLYSFRSFAKIIEFFWGQKSTKIWGCAFVLWVMLFYSIDLIFIGALFLFLISFFLMIILIIFRHPPIWRTKIVEIFTSIFLVYCVWDPFHHIEWFLD